ncbi:MAG: hypothetical protein WAV55_09945 [Clostridiaceae bacterium]
MSIKKFSNDAAKAQRKIMVKPVKATPEEKPYYPVMIELTHLLEMTHTILNEDDIISRIHQLESENPESVLTNGIFWQMQGETEAMLLDERSLATYKSIFEEYLNPELIENLRKFLEGENEKRLADYQAASNDEKEKFKKIIVVSLS